MSQLYIFNPDHDLALASDSDHFDAPLSAKQFATDFSLLPLWYAEKYSFIWAERVDVEWFESMKKLFPQFKDYRIVSSYEEVDAIRPWGWNKTIRRTLEKHSLAHVPTVAQLDALRELQHRKLSIEATSYLQDIQSDTLRLAKPAQLLSSNEIAQFVENHSFSIFKAPWSGSGKGIIRSLGSLSENLRNRAKILPQSNRELLPSRSIRSFRILQWNFGARTAKRGLRAIRYFFRMNMVRTWEIGSPPMCRLRNAFRGGLLKVICCGFKKS